jgi:hypothetical protein
MGRVVAVMSVLLVALAGCAGSNESKDASPDDVVVTTQTVDPKQTSAAPGSSGEASTAPAGSSGTQVRSFTIAVEAGEARAGQSTMINISLVDAEGNLDTNQVSWVLYAEDVDDEENALLLEGNGLPGAAEIVFDFPGSYGIFVEATAEGYKAAEAEMILEVLAAAATGPCAGAAVQPTFMQSGLFYGAVLFSGFYHYFGFDLTPCQSSMTFFAESSGAAVDIDIRVYDPDGNKVAESTDRSLFTDGPLVIDDPALMAKAGTWEIRLYGYAAGPGTYDVTVDFTV